MLAQILQRRPLASAWAFPTRAQIHASSSMQIERGAQGCAQHSDEVPSRHHPGGNLETSGHLLERHCISEFREEHADRPGRRAGDLSPSATVRCDRYRYGDASQVFGRSRSPGLVRFAQEVAVAGDVAVCTQVILEASGHLRDKTRSCTDFPELCHCKEGLEPPEPGPTLW